MFKKDNIVVDYNSSSIIGRVIRKVKTDTAHTYTDKGGVAVSVPIQRQDFLVDSKSPVFTEDRDYIRKLVQGF